MLGSLTQDLQELGITATPAGTCTACRKPIAGKVSPRTSSPVPLPAPSARSVPWSCFRCPPCLPAGAHSPGQNLAPRALHLRLLQAGAGQPALLRAGWAGVLRGRLPPGLLPPLRLLCQPHP